VGRTPIASRSTAASDQRLSRSGLLAGWGR